MNDIFIQQRLSENQKIFFSTLSNYIDDEIHFYGSIRRFDYIPEKSDIDIDIFTHNEHSIINKLSTLLNLKKNEFQKVVYRIDNQIVNGYKTKYQDIQKNIIIEISIYNMNDRLLVIKQHDKANKLPFIILFLLYIVKLFYYRLGIFSDKIYSKIKNYLIHMSGERNFILL